MKVRTGFVSNSSSSSFCIFGIDVKYGDIETQLINDFTAEELAEAKSKNKRFDETNFRDLITLFCKKNSFDYIDDFEGDTIYIGRDPGSIGDDETGREFRNSIGDKLKPFVGDKQPKWHEGEIAC